MPSWFPSSVSNVSPPGLTTRKRVLSPGRAPNSKSLVRLQTTVSPLRPGRDPASRRRGPLIAADGRQHQRGRNHQPRQDHAPHEELGEPHCATPTPGMAPGTRPRGLLRDTPERRRSTRACARRGLRGISFGWAAGQEPLGRRCYAGVDGFAFRVFCVRHSSLRVHSWPRMSGAGCAAPTRMSYAEPPRFNARENSVRSR
jgi:hypothetical protein